MADFQGSKMALPQKLQNALVPQEDIEFIAQPMESIYQKMSNRHLLIASGLFVLINGFMLFGNSADNAKPFMEEKAFWGLVVLNVIVVLPFFWAGYGIRKNHLKSFYAYSNMRIIYTDHYFASTLKSHYFKDIHHLSAQRQKIVIDMGDYTDASTNTKKRHRIYGVSDPEDFVQRINQKLLVFRDPSALGK